jgi:predicted metallopeptidase
VALNGVPGEIYHFSTGQNISIRYLVEMIAEQMQVSFEAHVEVVADRLCKDSAYLLDSSKAKKELGWKAQISLEQGIEESIGWVKGNLEELKNTAGLDVMHITYIRVIDVVGSINDAYARFDTANNKINDPFPTPFPSGGFDLDAVGVINMQN